MITVFVAGLYEVVVVVVTVGTRVAVDSVIVDVVVIEVDVLLLDVVVGVVVVVAVLVRRVVVVLVVFAVVAATAVGFAVVPLVDLTLVVVAAVVEIFVVVVVCLTVVLVVGLAVIVLLVYLAAVDVDRVVDRVTGTVVLVLVGSIGDVSMTFTVVVFADFFRADRALGDFLSSDKSVLDTDSGENLHAAGDFRANLPAIPGVAGLGVITRRKGSVSASLGVTSNPACWNWIALNPISISTDSTNLTRDASGPVMGAS